MSISTGDHYSPIASSVASSNETAKNGGEVTRRLTNAKVRSIFECLHHNQPPPDNLPFTIVPVGQNGKDLSPPSYEFECRYCNGSNKRTVGEVPM
jgi:hypothetical protein